MPMSPLPNCETSLAAEAGMVAVVEVVLELPPDPQAARNADSVAAAPVPPAIVRNRLRETGSAARRDSALVCCRSSVSVAGSWISGVMDTLLRRPLGACRFTSWDPAGALRDRISRMRGSGASEGALAAASEHRCEDDRKLEEECQREHLDEHRHGVGPWEEHRDDGDDQVRVASRGSQLGRRRDLEAGGGGEPHRGPENEGPGGGGLARETGVGGGADLGGRTRGVRQEADL